MYCRISQDRLGEGLGVERQEADCRKLAADLGWGVVRVFVDNDTSAYGRKPRPQYRAMLAELATGTTGGLLSWHTDRLYRSIPDLSELVQVCEDHEVTIRTVKAGKIDLSTPTGRLNATMFAGIARYEVERSAERVRSAKQQQALAGKFRGGPRPFGYTDGGMDLVPDEADAIREAAAQLLSGVSLRSIALAWMGAGIKTARGTETWTATSVRKVLTRARNAGLIEQGGKIVGPALWPAIFDVDTLHALRAVIADPTRRTSVSYERAHQGSGVYRCGKCSATMRVLTMGRTKETSYKAYSCSASPHLSQRKDALDEFVDALVIERLSREDAKVVLESGDGPDLAALQVERDGLQARKDELAGLFAAGTIDGSQLSRGSAELQQRLGRIDAQLAAARETSPVANLALSGERVGEVWAGLSPDLKGKVIDHLMTVTVLPVGSGQRAPGGGLLVERVQVDWKVAEVAV
ncbi:recombinase family protein [Prescottella defluvii]|uniref:recombinase family protein n=1 Tax=Prescottella defluvii TaxID=1323361 RepID=UPI0039EC8D25